MPSSRGLRSRADKEYWLPAYSEFRQDRHGEVGVRSSAACQANAARQLQAIQHAPLDGAGFGGGERALDPASPACALAATFRGNGNPRPLGAFKDALTGLQRNPR